MGAREDFETSAFPLSLSLSLSLGPALSLVLCSVTDLHAKA